MEAMKKNKLAIEMLPGENWWGLCNAFGRKMPFTAGTSFECDLRKDIAKTRLWTEYKNQ